MFPRFLFVFFAFISFLCSDEIETFDINFAPNPTPWFTGPLLAPSGRVESPGKVKLQPYFNTFVNVGEYNKHWHTEGRDNFYDINLRVQTKVGVVKNLDVQVVPHFVYRRTQGEQSVNIGDLSLDLNIQLVKLQKINGYPALKLALRSNAPIGKYQHLSARKERTDATGTGCWFPGAALAFSSIWHLKGVHYLGWRLFGEYRLGVPVHVKGRSVYGGDSSTRGTVYPGNVLTCDTAVEYNFTQNWAFACDLRYTHSNRTRSSGKKAQMLKGPSREAFSLAPAIEYNFTHSFGMIGGVWFSVAGRNYPKFINGMLSCEMHF